LPEETTSESLFVPGDLLRTFAVNNQEYGLSVTMTYMDKDYVMPVKLLCVGSTLQAQLAGPSGQVFFDQSITLNASASFDPDGQPFSFQFSCTRVDNGAPCSFDPDAAGVQSGGHQCGRRAHRVRQHRAVHRAHKARHRHHRPELRGFMQPAAGPHPSAVVVAVCGPPMAARNSGVLERDHHQLPGLRCHVPRKGPALGQCPQRQLLVGASGKPAHVRPADHHRLHVQ
ncbi:REJ domain-containing protein, partial [Haematococcus lacustris]